VHQVREIVVGCNELIVALVSYCNGVCCLLNFGPPGFFLLGLVRLLIDAYVFLDPSFLGTIPCIVFPGRVRLNSRDHVSEALPRWLCHPINKDFNFFDPFVVQYSTFLDSLFIN
jgi:hypothetical protein